MTQLSILELAQNNRDQLNERFEETKNQATDQSKLEKFEAFLGEHLNTSINAKLYDLLQIIKSEQYLNAWEYYDTEDKAEDHFSKKAPVRITFDKTFVEGKKFKYLALNAGNMGIPFWGSFCIVIRLEYFSKEEPVFLMRNSLELDETKTEHYFFTEGDEEVNTSCLQDELAEKPNYQQLIVVKKSREIEEDFSYPEIVCNGESLDFFEMITTQNIDLHDNFFIRINAKESRKLRQAMRKHFSKPHEAKADFELPNQKKLLDLIERKNLSYELYG